MVSTAAAPGRSRFQRLIIGLGWLGLALVLLEQLCRPLPLELADQEVRNWIYRGATGLLALGPRALYLQFWPQLTRQGRWAAGGLAVVLALPFAWLLLFRLLAGANDVFAERVLVRYPDGAYVVDRTLWVNRGHWQGRLVTVRPLLWQWQLVTAADTNALPVQEQRRLRWYQLRKKH